MIVRKTFDDFHKAFWYVLGRIREISYLYFFGGEALATIVKRNGWEVNIVSEVRYGISEDLKLEGIVIHAHPHVPIPSIQDLKEFKKAKIPYVLMASLWMLSEEKNYLFYYNIKSIGKMDLIRWRFSFDERDFIRNYLEYIISVKFRGREIEYIRDPQFAIDIIKEVYIKLYEEFPVAKVPKNLRFLREILSQTKVRKFYKEQDIEILEW